MMGHDPQAFMATARACNRRGCACRPTRPTGGGMTDMIRTWWPVAVSVIAAIAWLIRLEARGISNGAEIKRLWSQRKEDMDAAKDSRDRMDRRLDEIGSDIKTLLRGMGK